MNYPKQYTEEVSFSHTATRAEQNARGCIRTFTNKLVNPWLMSDDDIDIEDIAHQVSNETRYAGAVGFYSVGQHCLEVVREAELAGHTDPRFLLACLLHDSEEAYFKDLDHAVYYRERRSFDDKLQPGDIEIHRWAAGYAAGPFLRKFKELREVIVAEDAIKQLEVCDGDDIPF